ncbi:achaete-scute homolog 1-like [Stegodyphus dumicola]|uniref:achaete-scute homolog 1-like n=1 Tax=Stegodyphus dumicola TaxID=202533 RepID=UPI0015B17135|nr:achaete-scute homolog 1-like [Stegodyphus dumicola]
MVSVEAAVDRMMASREEARRLLYLRSGIHPQFSNISASREEALTLNVRRSNMDLGSHSQQQLQHPNHHRIRCQETNSGSKRGSFGDSTGGPSTAVSRRNARERKRVRLVNLGFSTLRERVPAGAKNKKLSKVETLRAAIEYIKQLQQMLGMPDRSSYDDNQLQAMMMLDENYGPDDCSSVASSEDVSGQSGQVVGSGDLSPASSHPSDCSLVSSPYTSHQNQDEHLIDIGVWFS